MPDVHVIPAPDGGWSVKVEEGDRAMRHADTKEEAERIAKEQLSSWPEGGEVVIHNEDGRIRDTDTIGNANEGPDKDQVH